MDRYGQQHNINQAHYFVAFFIAGYQNLFKEVSNFEAFVLDLDNSQDQALGWLAIELGHQASIGTLDWEKLPKTIYESIKE